MAKFQAPILYKGAVLLSKLGWIAVLVVTASGALMAEVPQTAVPLLDCDGLPCVEATIGGKTVRLGIDTGDEASVIDAKLAADLKLAELAQEGAPAGSPKTVKIEGIKLGDVELPTQEAYAMDIAKWVKDKQMPPIDGTLAYTAFKDRLLTFDWPHHLLKISAPLSSSPECPGKCGELSLITFGKKGPHIVVATGFTLNGKPVTAQIDSMYSGTMLIYPTAVEKLGLEKDAKTDAKRFFNYTDGGVDMMEASAASEGFESEVLAKNPHLYFAGPKVHLPDGLFDATVGVELMQGSAFSLDLKGMKIWKS
jgi:hypothetical protein